LLRLFFGLPAVVEEGDDVGDDEDREYYAKHRRFPVDQRCWDYLPVRDLVVVRCLSKEFYFGLQWCDYADCRDDDGRDYSVPFPGFPGLFATRNDHITDLVSAAAEGPSAMTTTGRASGLYRHQLASLRAMHRAETAATATGDDGNHNAIIGRNRNGAFGMLRGGVLGDAPGLGKTITMLALVSQTAGTRPVDPPEFWDATGIQAGWNDLRRNVAAAPTILKAIKPITDYMNDYFPKSSSEYKMFQQLRNDIQPPYRDGGDDDNHLFPTLRHMERYVVQTLRDFVPSAPLELFRRNVINLKAGLDKRNRKLLMSTQLQRKWKRMRWERSLQPSSATLIVVPDALLEHWFQQIWKHVNLRVFASEDTGTAKTKGGGDNLSGIVYLDGIGDMADVVERRQTMRNASYSAGNDAATAQHRHQQPWELHAYLIVITTFSWCEAEFAREVAAGLMEGLEDDPEDASADEEAEGDRNGSAKPRRRRNRKNRKRRYQDAVESDVAKHSPLLQKRWLRLVVDEGHELGTYAAGNEVTRFIHQIAAERRWVLSGTPTTGNEDSKRYTATALDQLQRLLLFLRHPEYGVTLPSSEQQQNHDVLADEAHEARAELARDAWVSNVKEPFLSRHPAGKEELLRVLRETMVIHRKEDINLPSPIFRQIEKNIDVPAEIQTELCANAKSSLDLVRRFDEYLHSTDFQVLVDQAQAEYIVEAVQEARRALMDRRRRRYTIGTFSSAITSAREDTGEYDIRKDFRPIKAVVYSSITNNLLSVLEHVIRNLDSQNVAEMHNDSPDIGDMSAELARFRHGYKECRTCPVCKRQSDVKSERKRSRCPNLLLEVVAVSDGIYGKRFLIEPERITRPFVHLDRMQGEALQMYGKSAKFWRRSDRLEVDIRDPHPLLPARESEQVWEEYGSEECKQRARNENYEGRDWYFGPLPVFENGRVEVELRKWQRCGVFHSHGRWFEGPRLNDQPIERVKEDVFIMSLNASLAHGLDLSFVTHIFLLEPIEDAALLEQVASRAHRMGATGPVTVETVNTFYRVSEKMQAGMNVVWNEKESLRNAAGTAVIQQDRAKVLSKIVCQHCYRQFGTMELAEEHERTICPRNPANASVVDPFHLSSVYRDIRPPPPLDASAIVSGNTPPSSL